MADEFKWVGEDDPVDFRPKIHDIYFNAGHNTYKTREVNHNYKAKEHARFNIDFKGYKHVATAETKEIAEEWIRNESHGRVA